MKLVPNKIKCQAGCAFNCRGEVPASQILRLEWKKERKSLLVCTECFADIQLRQLKSTTVDQSALRTSGYYEQGARTVDFKSYYEKWIKQTKQQTQDNLDLSL